MKIDCQIVPKLWDYIGRSSAQSLSHFQISLQLVGKNSWNILRDICALNISSGAIILCCGYDLFGPNSNSAKQARLNISLFYTYDLEK